MHGTPIELDEAWRRIDARARVCADREAVPLAASLGRHLAADAICEDPWPTADRSAMDGFALAGGDRIAAAGARFAVRGDALAGHPFDGVLGAGEAVRIMTGGVVPRGADRVAKVEDTTGFSGDVVELTGAVAPGDNVRPEGSEISPGTVVVRRGARIRAAEIGALAVLGRASVEVVRRPRVAILSTGDEIVDIESVPGPHQVRDSNAWALAAKVVEAGGEPVRLGIAADDEASLRSALERGLAADLLLTIGGVSKGTHDLVHGTLLGLGVEPVFHGVALKPGKPTYFGERCVDGRETFVFGLPGNPASSFTTFDLFVVPLLTRWFGGGTLPDRLQVRAGGVPCRKNWRTQAIPARLRLDDTARAFADLAPLRPSGDPFGLLDGDGYGLIPGGVDPADLSTIRFVRYAAGARHGAG